MYSIRKADPSDALQVHRLRNAAIRAECSRSYSSEIISLWTEGDVPSEQFARVIAESFYVAEANGEIVATGSIDRATGKLDAIFVSPVHMRKGLARLMVTFLERMALQDGLPRLHLEATLNAVEFYIRQGFAKVRDAKYQSPRGFSMDCVVMEKPLQPSAA
ncbi:GNAT family N-acetyltransferase [Undibacterium sp. CY7W]|uniref:GNAT family N-acetyltransferase n=1 Tax=Undibacterium rugosum TaxID=2762291 RepID=A0A923KZC1_9BURK|nr:GNAT family N-acetyltransferase [Undibacterium rugosum]MBC3935793.1 GNAT family N-acetyltransferase [Undibacterium rugosum]